MNEFQAALLLGALVTAALAYRVPRAVLWIGVGAACFAITTAWARYGLPYPPAFTAACDAAVCLLIYFFGKRRWEMRLWNLFQCSVMVSILYLAGIIGPKWAYVAALELVNWLALLLIAGTAITARAGENGNAFSLRPLHRFSVAHRALYAKRKDPPFTARR